MSEVLGEIFGTKAGESNPNLRLVGNLERRYLLLYTLDKLGEVKSYTKFHAMIDIVEKKIFRMRNFSLGYSFEDKFMALTDPKFSMDLKKLTIDGYNSNDPVIKDQRLGIHTHKLLITKKGKLLLRTMDVEKRLKNIFGDELLDELIRTLSELNKKEENEVLIEAFKN